MPDGRQERAGSRDRDPHQEGVGIGVEPVGDLDGDGTEEAAVILVTNAGGSGSFYDLAIIRKQLDRLVAIGAPIVFGIVIFYSSELAFDRATMGRFFFIALLVVLVMSFRPLAHPKSGVASRYYENNPDSWLSKLRWLWYLLATGVPLLLGVLSLLAATQLGQLRIAGGGLEFGPRIGKAQVAVR